MPTGTQSQAPWEGSDNSPNVEQPLPKKEEQNDDTADVARAEENGMILREGEEAIDEAKKYPWGKELGCLSGN